MHLKILITSVPVIIAGILNMMLLKSNLFSSLNKPIDNNIKLKDGKPLFGKNKTWRGFFAYVIITAIITILWGLLSKYIISLEKNNFFYVNYNNTFLYNLLVGILLGLFYAIFELPNSFLKRRVDIKEGKTKKGFLKPFFIFLDQADSLFGCVLVLSFFYDMTFLFYIYFVFLGSITHLLINILLYFLKLRKNMF